MTNRQLISQLISALISALGEEDKDMRRRISEISVNLIKKESGDPSSNELCGAEPPEQMKTSEKNNEQSSTSKEFNEIIHDLCEKSKKGNLGKKPVIAYNEKGAYLFESIEDAGKALKIQPSDIRFICNGTAGHRNGMKFNFIFHDKKGEWA